MPSTGMEAEKLKGTMAGLKDEHEGGYSWDPKKKVPWDHHHTKAREVPSGVFKLRSEMNYEAIHSIS